jgi:hypothetical protein
MLNLMDFITFSLLPTLMIILRAEKIMKSTLIKISSRTHLLRISYKMEFMIF